MEHSSETVPAALKKMGGSIDIAEIADAIGPLDTAAYLALKRDWKADYAQLSRTIREAKVMMKDKDTGRSWQWPRENMRREARTMMALRAAIRELGRRHWATKKALAA